MYVWMYVKLKLFIPVIYFEVFKYAIFLHIFLLLSIFFVLLLNTIILPFDKDFLNIPYEMKLFYQMSDVLK